MITDFPHKKELDLEIPSNISKSKSIHSFIQYNKIKKKEFEIEFTFLENRINSKLNKDDFIVNFDITYNSHQLNVFKRKARQLLNKNYFV